MGPSVQCISEYNLNLLANGLSGVVCNQEMHNQYLKWQIRLPTAYSWCFAEIFYHLLVFSFTSRSPAKGAKKSISPYSYLALKYLMFCKPHKLLAGASTQQLPSIWYVLYETIRCLSKLSSRKKVLDLSCQSLHVFDLFLSRNIFINTTLSVRFAIKQAVRQIYLWGMLGNASCPDWHEALVVSEVCESSGGDKFSSVACPLTISSMNSISAFSWALLRTETSFHSTEHVDKMQK